MPRGIPTLRKKRKPISAAALGKRVKQVAKAPVKGRHFVHCTLSLAEHKLLYLLAAVTGASGAELLRRGLGLACFEVLANQVTAEEEGREPTYGVFGPLVNADLLDKIKGALVE